MNYWKVSTLALAGALALVVGKNVMVNDAGAGGQPHMELALKALNNAQSELNAAEPDKGGFRAAALKDIAPAIVDVQKGIDYARDHAPKGGAGNPTGGPTTGQLPHPK